MTLIPTDELLLRFRETGSSADYGAFYDATLGEVAAAASRLAPDTSSADDLVQATYLGALESVARFTPGRPAMSWLIGILNNHARMERWRNGRRPEADRMPWAEPVDPVEQAEGRELVLKLESALERLGEAYRPVMVLHLQHGLNASEIASALGRPQGTVRTQVVRGIAMLRQLLPASLASSLLVQLASGQGVDAIRHILLARVEESSSIGRGPLDVAGASKAVTRPPRSLRVTLAE